jgi:hypothetical protein
MKGHILSAFETKHLIIEETHENKTAIGKKMINKDQMIAIARVKSSKVYRIALLLAICLHIFRERNFSFKLESHYFEIL